MRLALDQSTVSKWLRKLREAKMEERRRRVLELYLQGCTQQEIADKVGLAQSTVSEIIGNMKIHIMKSPPQPSDLWLFTYRLMPSMDPSRLRYPGNLPRRSWRTCTVWLGPTPHAPSTSR